ncbi:MAG: 7-cyano-7-deazaguanine synthase QueC [Magnetococcales bacterium]|nr:7-cyano-7-deazaguanine synthase QueC [Magnetococcales bacterium]MBF0261728.1 7-cyano-7-deazaguanine synthase QueC [Magnetococcales bacterium]
MVERAVVLLSGGMDSAVCLHAAHALGRELYPISFRYGQRHRQELAAAEAIVARLPVARWLVLDLPLDRIGGSALTDPTMVPAKGGLGEGIPATYVPARNTIFLSLALGWAETLQAQEIFIGVNAIDYSGYPDCRPVFVEAFERLANLATREGVTRQPFAIRAPLLHLSKAEIVRKGLALGVDFSLTRSCYDPTEADLACGRCDACRLRLAGFEAAGASDPIGYVRT